MTDIPGTQNPSPKPVEPPQQEETVSVVNIRELKRLKKEGPLPEENLLWYNKLSYWVLFGIAASAAVSLLAIINWRFLFLTPLGPIIAFVLWHVRRAVRSYDQKTKGFFR